MKRALSIYPVLLLAVTIALVELVYVGRVKATTFTVTTAADNGDNVNPTPGSLRKAIIDANNSGGLDTISFSIPGAGVQTITLLSALPAITDPVIIDGYTQPGSNANTVAIGSDATLLIELKGASAGANVNGLTISAGSSTVRGLVINRFTRVGIELATNGGNTIEGCYIGTSASGTANLNNSNNGVFINATANNLIGGTTPAARNILSGNFNGVSIFAGGAAGNLVQGNYIGLDKSGAVALGNTPGDGVVMSGGAGNNTIGGTASGAGNVISGNAEDGVSLIGVNNNTVQGNLIGTDATGTLDRGNARIGVIMRASSSGNTIGGTVSGARNVVSGNNDGGIDIEENASNNTVKGNYIGTDVNGNADLGNLLNGIQIFSGANNTIGGTTAAERNIISGNDQSGVRLLGSTGTQILGNFIGTNATGTAAIGNLASGIQVSTGTSSLIVGGTTATTPGGACTGACNLISGNNGNGVTLGGGGGHTLLGNYIGTNSAGTAALGNSASGVVISTSGNKVGGTAVGQGNVIAFNSGDGVFINSGAGNAVRANSIFGNNELGIDLSPNGVTPNDAGDADSGPNNLQNFPVIGLICRSGGNITIEGTLASTASTTFTIDFYSSTNPDDSGFGEGGAYIGSTMVTTNPSGSGSFTASFPFAGGGNITATATDPAGNTSEFSQSVATTVIWDGSSSSDWNTGSNWSRGIVPTSSDDVNIPDTGVTNQPTISLTDVTIRSLTVAASRALTLTNGRTLTLDGTCDPVTLLNFGSITASGSATFQTQGMVTLDNRGSFGAPLSILSGTTTADDMNDGVTVFDGAISVLAGATLDTAQSANGWTVIANADVTVGGTLSGQNRFRFKGTTFTNNGNVSVINTEFNRAGAQTLTGSGAFVSNTATVISGSTVTLGSDHQMSTLIINSGGAMDITSRTLSLSGGGTPLTSNGSFTTTGSTINFNGSGSQTISALNYNNLTSSNSGARTLASSGTIGIAGAFSPGTNSYTVTGSTIEYNGQVAQTLPASFTPYNNLTINNAAGATLSSAVTVNGTLTLAGGNVDAGANTLAISASGSISRTSGYILGNLKKTFSAAGSFIYPVGTANGYSPVDTTITAGTGDLMVRAVQGPQPVLDPSKSLQRYWTLSGSGITADLTFRYLATDVMGNENIYRLVRVSGGTAAIFPASPPTVDPINHTAFTTGVSSFSDWTAGEPTPPTAIDLASFAANGYDGGTLLEWQTGFEADNLGFNVYREESGKRVLVNPQMVAGSALVAGSGVAMRAGRSYAWWDKLAKGAQASYWLEDFDINGKSTLHGPFVVKAIGGALPVRSQAALLSQIGEAQPIITAQATLLPLQQPQSNGPLTGESGYWPSIASGPAVKLSVREEGWYRVTQAELLAAGLDPRADPRTLQLYLGGVEQALLVTGESDGRLDSTDVVEFYGKGLDTPSSDTHVYWLVSGNQPGKRVKLIASDGKPGGGRSFSYTVERKERSIYFSGLLNGEAENFFGRVVASQPVEQSLPLQHLDATSSAAEVEVAMQGVTDLATSPDHQVSVSLNGSIIGRVIFDGRQHKVERFSIYPSQLNEGENTVTLIGQGGADVTLIDYVRINYSHTYSPDNDELELTASKANGASQTIEGFSTPLIRVMDVSDPTDVQELAGQIEPSKHGDFAVTVDLTGSDPRTLMAFADGEVKRPASITSNRPSRWRSPNNGADHLVITRRELAASLEPLRALRQSQGLSVAVVEVEDIYDEFTFGEKSSQSLKDFIGYAVTSWKKKPRFVLLAGDASFDSRNYLGFGDNDQVPTRLIDTLLMETASDEWLADWDNDGLAEIAVGRLPVRTASEASTMVAKIVGYERSRPSEEVLLISDESSGYNFEGASTRLIPLVPANIRVSRIDRGPLGSEAAKKRLIEAINRGQKIVNYAGHGSVTLWGGNLLTGSDAERFENVDHLSLFVMMTCLNGYFHEAAIDSLGEALMKADGGAVAVWTSTGMTMPLDQWTMNEELYRVIFGGTGTKGQPLTIGEAAARAKRTITDIDIRRTWVLLGDPATKLR
jgi:peptidase C25-like protein